MTPEQNRDQMRYSRDTARMERNAARGQVNNYQRQRQEPETVWPADPPDGGTP